MAAVAMSTAMVGCGEIVEVPVAMSETGQTESETSGNSGPEPTGGDETTQAPDVDDASTSGLADDGASSSGGEPPLQSIPFCLGAQRDVLTIPEDGTAGVAIVEVSPPAGVVGLQVTLRVTHPRLSDLRVELRAPDDTVITLLQAPACDAANIDAQFQDDAAELGDEQCADGVAGITGPVRAVDALDAVLGSAASSGSWTLELTDTRPDVTGTLDQVCIVLITEDG